jgi:hypothetical protein
VGADSEGVLQVQTFSQVHNPAAALGTPTTRIQAHHLWCARRDTVRRFRASSCRRSISCWCSSGPHFRNLTFPAIEHPKHSKFDP